VATAPARGFGRCRDRRSRFRRRAAGVRDARDPGTIGGVGDFGVDRGDVEIHLGLQSPGSVARREIGRDPLGDPAVAATTTAERLIRHDRARSSVRFGGADPAPAGPGAPDTVAIGWAVDLAGRGDAGRIGGPQFEHVEAVGCLVGAVARPGLDGIRGGIEELVESLLFIRSEPRQHVIDRAPVRLADQQTRGSGRSVSTSTMPAC